MEMDTTDPPRRSSEDSDDTPINLATSREEAINLSRCNNMSAKMRLKKQRLEAVAKAASEMQHTVVSGTSVVISTESNNTQFYDTTSALHRLAEAAERKQVSQIMSIKVYIYENNFRNRLLVLNSPFLNKNSNIKCSASTVFVKTVCKDV